MPSWLKKWRISSKKTRSLTSTAAQSRKRISLTSPQPSAFSNTILAEHLQRRQSCTHQTLRGNHSKPQAALRRKLIQTQHPMALASNMHCRPHASDHSLSAGTVTRASATGDAEPLSTALKSEPATRRFQARCFNKGAEKYAL